MVLLVVDLGLCCGAVDDGKKSPGFENGVTGGRPWGLGGLEGFSFCCPKGVTLTLMLLIGLLVVVVDVLMLGLAVET